MSLGQAIDEALTPGAEAGPVTVETDKGSATVDVVEADRIGVRVRGIRVTTSEDLGIERIADLPDALRDLPTRVVPVEVDASLGGATLRTPPREMRGKDFFEVEVRGAESKIRRLRPAEGGGREELDWTMTRDQLGRVLDGLSDE